MQRRGGHCVGEVALYGGGLANEGKLGRVGGGDGEHADGIGSGVDGEKVLDGVNLCSGVYFMLDG